MTSMQGRHICYSQQAINVCMLCRVDKGAMVFNNPYIRIYVTYKFIRSPVTTTLFDLKLSTAI